MPGLANPQGELETLTIAPETVFGQRPSPFSTSMISHCFTQFQPKSTIDAIVRAPRASLNTPLPGTGGRSVSMSLDVEPDEDTFPQLLAYTMGAQTNPSNTLYSSTLTSAATTGNTSVPVASALFVYVGQSIVIGGTTPETVTVTGISGNNGLTIKFTPALANNHANSSTVTVTSGAAAKLTKITSGTPLPSFTVEVNRPGSVCTDYLGACVDQMQLSMAMKQGLKAKFSLVAQQDLIQGSPQGGLSLSTLNPYIFEQQFTYAMVGGELLGNSTNASLLSFNITVNNNLNKSNWTFGNGNLVRSFPEQLRKISGTMQLYFETNTQLTNFNASQTGGNNPSISMLIPVVGTDTTSGNNNYAIGIWMPAVFLQTVDIGDDTSKAVTQTYSFSCGESMPGANDTLSFYCVIAQSTKY